MTPALRVLKNSTALSLSVFMERGIAFILPLYVARFLGKEIWGDYSTALAFVTMAAAISPWGFLGLLPRKVARDRDQAVPLLFSAGIIGAAISVITILLVIIIVRYLNYPPQIEQLINFGVLVTLLPQTEALLFESAITGVEKMEWIVAVRFPLTILRILGSIFLLSQGFGIEVLFVILAVYYALACTGYTYLFWRSSFPFHFRFDWILIRAMAWQALPFVLIVSISEIFRQIDRVFLSKLWDSEAVGIYATGILLVQLMYMIAPAVMSALFPGLSRAYLNSRERFSVLVSQIFKLLAVGIFPLMMIIIASSGLVIPLVFGAEYEPSVLVLQITGLSILPSFASRLLFRATLASNNERVATILSLIGNASSLLFNALLIPRYGVVGASVALVGTTLVQLGQNLIYVSRYAEFDYVNALLRPAICVMASLLIYALLLSWNVFAAWSASMVVFVFTLLLTNTITRDDLASFALIRQQI